MWDRFFRQQAYIGITRSRMRWYVRKATYSRLLMRDNPHATFWGHDCIPSKLKVELLTVRKIVNVEISAI